MILRENWKDGQKHLEYRRSVHQDTKRTLQTRGSALQLLLVWAGEKALTRAPELRPAYPEFLARQRRDGNPLARGTQETWLSMAKIYFQWAMAAHPRRYRRVTTLWLDSLRPARAKGHRKERQAYGLQDVRAILAIEDERLGVRRVQAATAMLFLSGARIGAFVTLPISAVDVARRQIQQWTDLGVRTKFSKSATTFLLDIPDLLAVVARWDALVRQELPAEAMWYPNITGARIKAIEGTTLQSPYRSRSYYRGLRLLCERAGVTYLSPHKLRHGHVMHALQNAKTPADWKAISQNVMHSGLGTTDEIYGILKDEDIAGRIGRMGGNVTTSPVSGALSQGEILAQIQALMAQLQQ